MTTMSIKRTPAHDRLLKAAYELLLQFDGDMGKVKMQAVVRRAGLTSGAFYNVWPGGIAAFQQSLLEFALATEHVSYVNKILAGLQGVGPEVMPLSEVARLFGAADAQHLKDDAGFRVQVALWARHGADSAVASALQASYRELATRYEDVYDSVLRAYGRTWRAPFDSAAFATLLTALAEGLALRSSVDPASVPSDLAPADSSEPWEMFGLSIAILLSTLTEQSSDAPTSAWSLVVQLDGSET